jgi:hypothetical protein
VPLDGRTVRVHEQFSRWIVTASPAVDGRPTAGFAAEAWVGAKGQVVHGSGWLSEPEADASYPLIGVREAIERLQSRRLWFGRSDAPIPERYDQRCAIQKGMRCPPADTTRRITGIRLGLQHTAVLATGNRAGREAWLVPAYLFEINGDPDQVESVVAIQDRYLKVPQPLPAPAQPAPGGTPGGGPEPAPAPTSSSGAG